MKIARSRAFVRSRTMLRLLRLSAKKGALSPPGMRSAAPPMARERSPAGGSTLMTSAPKSPSCMVQNGPPMTCVRSTTRTPSRGRVMRAILARRRSFHDARIEDDLPVEDRHEALRVFDLGRRHRVEVAIPHREVRVLPDLDGADLLLEEHLVR